MQKYNSIDIAKIFCALLVVAIHVPPIGGFVYENVRYDFVRHCYARVAVPLFFVISGFLLFKKVDIYALSLDPIKKYLRKIIRLCFIWYIIYTPLLLSGCWHNGRSFVIDSFVYIRNFFLIGDLHLWYLQALIVSVALLAFLLYKKYPLKKIALLVTLLYIIGVLGDSWYGLISPFKSKIPGFMFAIKCYKILFVNINNAFFEGLFFIFIGLCFAHFPFNISSKKKVLGLLFSLILLILEYTFVHYKGLTRCSILYFSLVPVVVFVFSIVKDLRLKDSPMYKMFRNVSALVFYIHIWIRIFASLFLKYFSIHFLMDYYLTTVVMSIAVSICIIKLSETKYFVFLKKAY